MNLDFQAIKEWASKLSAAAEIFSDKLVFKRHIVLQRGQHISAVTAGLVGGTSGTAGTPFPIGWTVVKNGTGNYTITHNLGRTDYAVVCTFVGDSGNAKATGAIVVTTAASSFTVDIGSSIGNFSPDFFFAVLI